MPTRLLLQRFELGQSIIEHRMTSCGKKACGQCPHGPYWYQLFRVKDGKLVKKYLGKELPADIQKAIAEAPHFRKVATNVRSDEAV